MLSKIFPSYKWEQPTWRNTPSNLNHGCKNSCKAQEILHSLFFFFFLRNHTLGFRASSTNSMLGPPCTVHYKQHQGEILLCSFRLKSYSLGFFFLSGLLYLDILCSKDEQYRRKVLLSSFHFNGYTLEFYQRIPTSSPFSDRWPTAHHRKALLSTE